MAYELLKRHLETFRVEFIFESTIKLETESEKMIIQIKRHLSIYFVTNNKLMILMKIICHRIRQIANIKIENNYYGE